MSHHHFSKDFTKQFRNECGLYSPTPEFQYGNLLLKQFTGDDAEMAIIGETLSEKFFNRQLIDQIIHTLDNDDFPAACRLFNRVIALKKECEDYQRREPYTGHYYREQISMLGSFSELTHAFHIDFHEHVYEQLNNYYEAVQGSKECPVAESTSLRDIIDLTEFYLKNILAYYNYFIVSWQFEVNGSKATGMKGVQLTTYMAGHLQVLIVHIEGIMASIENTRLLFLTWEELMEIREMQELYN